MAYACRVRLAVAGSPLALAALFAVVPNAYAVDTPPAPPAAHTAPASGLAGPKAAEGRPHPGRDADQAELGVGGDPADSAGSRTQQDPRGTAPQGPADAAGAAPDDPVTPQDPAAPVNPLVPPADGSVPRREPATVPGFGRPAAGAGVPAMPSGGGTAPQATSPPAGIPRPGWTAPAAVPHLSAPPYDRTAEPPTGRVLRVLPFGTGLALLGAGLGVLAIRMRRG